MRGMWPWGGFGANPQPAHFPLWRNNETFSLAGGFAYSEGIYEDINKAIIAQQYWDDARDSIETVREYAAYEYGHDVANDVVEAVRLLEGTMARTSNLDADAPRLPTCSP